VLEAKRKRGALTLEDTPLFRKGGEGT
jgi:hypothetical protein